MCMMVEVMVLILTLLALLRGFWTILHSDPAPGVIAECIDLTARNLVVEGGKLAEKGDLEKAHSLAGAFVYIHNRLYIAILDEQMPGSVLRCFDTLNYKFIQLLDTKVNDIISRQTVLPTHKHFPAPSLEDVFHFNQMASLIQQTSPAAKIVFQARSDSAAQAALAFLLGCHMMLSHGLGFEETYLAISRVPGVGDIQGQKSPCISVRSCLRAFCRAKCHSWVNFADPDEITTNDDPSSIHIDEYLHYAR